MWGWKELCPVAKNPRLTWPNEYWEVIPFPPTPGVAPVIPAGVIAPWWKLPKSQWPIEAPWEPKIFGCWPASKVQMMENFLNHPPFGVIKLMIPRGPDDQLMDLQEKHHQIAFQKMKIHMPQFINYISPYLKMVSQTNAFGEQKFHFVTANWTQKEYDVKEWRRLMRERHYEEIMSMIANMENEPKTLRPATNLFTNEPQKEVTDLFT
jgi:hypothetical protein